MKAQYTDWIELYIENDLNQEERRDFENELAINPQLREEYALNTAMEDYIAYKRRMREMMNSPEWEEIEEDVDGIVKEIYREEFGIDVVKEIARENEQDSMSNTQQPASKFKVPGSKLKGSRKVLIWLGAAAVFAGL